LVSAAANACDVRAVAFLVLRRAAVDEVTSREEFPVEVRVTHVNARVDDRDDRARPVGSRPCRLGLDLV